MHCRSQWKKANLPVWVYKLSRFMQGNIGPRMEICGNSGLPIVMVPCLHQSNVCIKRKLWVWRDQKYIPLVGAKTVLTCTGLQTTSFHGGQHSVENGNLRKFGSTYPNGTTFPPEQCSYQKPEATRMERPKMYSPSRCKNFTYQYGPANYLASWGAV